MNDVPPKGVAHHILGTSANMLGICFIILSVVKTRPIPYASVLDQILLAPICAFFLASLSSYASLRPGSRSQRYERVADMMYMTGLSILAFAAVIFAVELIQ